MILPPPGDSLGNGVSFALPRDEPTLTVQAVVALPPLSPVERGTLAGALRSVVRQAGGYARGAILAMTVGPEGTTQALAPDHLRIGLHLQGSRSTEALSLLEAMLARPTFGPETLTDDVNAALAPRPLWTRIGSLPLAQRGVTTPDDARQIWAKVVRPERLVVAFGGRGAGGLSIAWDLRKIAWPRIPPSDYRPEPKPVTLPNGPARVGLLEAAALKGDADLGPTLLALTSLGAGKGSLGWRTLREARGGSYRIEATLAGTPEGWRPRLLFDLVPSDTGDDVRERLLKAVEGMGEPDLLRARGYLAAILRGEAFDALFTPLGRRLTDSLPDRAYLAAYLRLKTGRLAALPPVPGTTLEELRALIRALVEGSALRIEG